MKNPILVVVLLDGINFLFMERSFKIYVNLKKKLPPMPNLYILKFRFMVIDFGWLSKPKLNR